MTTPQPGPAATTRGRALAVLRMIALLAVIGWFGWYLVSHWREAEQALARTRPRWSLLAGSGVAVLAAYVVLIQVWRSILAGAGETLPWWPAVRIWTVSNLGKYVPGKVWQMSAMAVMARDQGVSGVAAAGSSVLSTLVTLVTGLAVTVLAGAQVLSDRRAAIVGAVACLLALAVMPIGLPLGERMLRRVTGRDVAFPRLAARAFLTAVVGTSLGWLLLGTGFHLLGRGLGVVQLTLPTSVAVFVGSYLAGFLALFSPGGIGVRETTMQEFLEASGVTSGDALVLVVASRVWLTMLEVLPALLLLAVGTTWRAAPPAAAPAARTRTDARADGGA